MAILSRSLPGSVPPRIPRKPAHQDCRIPGRAVLPAQGLARGNPRPPCHSCRGIPAPWACHSGKVVPAPRIQQREGIPAHSGGSEHPCAALRCAAPRGAHSQRQCVLVAGSGTRRGGCCGRPPSARPIARRSGSRLPRQPANPCGAASSGRRGGGSGGGTGGGRGGDSCARTAGRRLNLDTPRAARRSADPGTGEETWR